MKCRVCKNEFTPTARDVSKGDYLCVPCRSNYNRKNKEKRKALGLKSSGSDTWDPIKRVAWKNKYYSRRDIIEKMRDRSKERKQWPDERKKDLIRHKTKNAIQDGKIIKKPCSTCGAIKAQAHHQDYGDPFNIIWLCASCHKKQHDAIRAFVKAARKVKEGK
jgi:ribosomal protein S27AE